MEIILAIVVATAVIFFGALISMGNERQRKAIDDLREQTTLWAIHDLQIKRERLAKEIKFDDPTDWFRKIASRTAGIDSLLQVSGVFDDPRALVCDSEQNLHKIIFTPVSPGEIRRFGYRRHGRLSKDVNQNPLLSLPRKVPRYELSVLNGGILFDLELKAAWRSLTGQDLESLERIWIYDIS